jgi:hypothetical protein
MLTVSGAQIDRRGRTLAAAASQPGQHVGKRRVAAVLHQQAHRVDRRAPAAARRLSEEQSGNEAAGKPARQASAKGFALAPARAQPFGFWLPPQARVPPKNVAEATSATLAGCYPTFATWQKCRRAALQFNKERIFMNATPKISGPARFKLGQVVATPGALEACPSHQLDRCLYRHSRGDWGCVDKEDAATKDEAVKSGDRILSAYAIDDSKPRKGFGDNTLWIITEADRYVTTFLLPDEYDKLADVPKELTLF